MFMINKALPIKISQGNLINNLIKKSFDPIRHNQSITSVLIEHLNECSKIYSKFSFFHLLGNPKHANGICNEFGKMEHTRFKVYVILDF